MRAAPALDARVASLAEALGGLRPELRASLATLRDAGNVPGTLAHLSRVAMLLMRRLFAAANKTPPSDNLFDCIERAYADKLLPKEIWSSLHTIRTWSNPVDHAAEQVALTPARAENQLASLLDAVEWFHCECPFGPRLETIYTTSLDRMAGPTEDIAADSAARLHAEMERLIEETAGLEVEAAPPSADLAGPREDRIGELRAVMAAPAAALMLSDIEVSPGLADGMGSALGPALRLHDEIVRDCAGRHAGREISSLGGAFLFAFEHASDAIRCSVALHERLAQAAWPGAGRALRARVAVHAPDPDPAEADPVRAAVSTAARIVQAGFGGQSLVSDAASERAGPEAGADVQFIDLGPRQLREAAPPIRLMLAIQADAPAPEFIALRSLDVLPTNVPAEVDEFVGRERELAQVDALLSDGVRLLTITGPGGVGKTRLLQKIGALHLDRFRDGVWLVELADVPGPEQVPGAIASALHIPIAARSADPVADLVSSLARKELLLLLDNYDAVIEAAMVPHRILRGAPRVACIVTSRERLKVHGEYVLELPPMALPDSAVPIEQQLEAESVRLFCRRALEARAGREMTADDLSGVAVICQRVDGLPLAIELAAARLSRMTCSELLHSLEQRPDLLETDFRGLPARHRSIHATIEWSCGLLPAAEARTMEAVSVFRGGFFPEAAEAVCEGQPGVLDHLHHLRDRSLLQAEPRLDRTRYSMLPLVRQYARAKLGDRLDECRGRAAHYLAAHADTLHLRREIRDVQEANAELDNIRMSLEWLEAHGEPETIVCLVRAIWPIFNLVGAHDEAVRWLEAASKACRQLEDESWLARLLIAEAVSCKLTGDVAKAQASLRESLALAEHLGNEDSRRWALMEQGSVLHAAGDLSGARQVLENCLDAYRAVDNLWGIAECLRSLGRVERDCGLDQAAEARFTEALELEDPDTQAWGVSNTLYDLGLVRLGRGDLAGAVAAFRDSIRLCRQVADQPGLVQRLRGFAEAASRAGDTTAALEACREALIVARRHAPRLADGIVELMEHCSRAGQA